jgi:predicted CXXCH cytochrome family protein
LPHTDKRSSIARNNIASTCSKCHGKIEDVHLKVIKGELWEKEIHKLPACIDCHQPHKIRKSFYDVGLSNKECLNCHEKKNIKATSDGRSLSIDLDKLAKSVHNDIACSKCHIEASPSKIRSCETIKTKVNCGSCHDKVNSNYVKSSHGVFNAAGNEAAPTCTTCHGEHDVMKKTNPDSKIFTMNIPKLCSECHQDGHQAAVLLKKNGVTNIVNNYTESVHGKRLTKGGLSVTATCADCHTPHLESNHRNPISSTYKKNIPTTCGKCHWGIEEVFNNSIHSPEVSQSNRELPTCNNCHVAHSVRDPKDDAFRLSIMTTCGKCHEKISKLYFDTYHGKASLLGSSKSAKCSDCHSAHEIWPTNNKLSTLSRVNIVQTCSKCHPKANAGFTRYLAHATHHDPDKYPTLYITFWGMTLLLLGTFLISWIHTLLWLPKSLKMRKEIKAMKAAGAFKGKRVMRFNLLSRILHIVMIMSFLTLASTGMILKFSHTAWAQFGTKMIGGVEIAGFIHRIAAVFLFGVFFTHIYDLIVNKRKEYKSWKEMLFGHDSMIPNKKDFHDFIASMKWFMGKGPRPNYGRWTYWEKFDYFAVFWGIFVIGSTGLSLWFPYFITKFIPGELLNVFTIIHSDEALLASGFIFTVHFFNTHFRPEKFPMDTVIFSGSYELEEFQLDRPDEYQRLLEEGKLESLFVEEPDSKLKRAISIFGWSALIIGLILVFLIIFSIMSSFV